MTTIEKQPGPPPRPGLVWYAPTNRWRRPDENKKEGYVRPDPHGLDHLTTRDLADRMTAAIENPEEDGQIDRSLLDEVVRRSEHLAGGEGDTSVKDTKAFRHEVVQRLTDDYDSLDGNWKYTLELASQFIPASQFLNVNKIIVHNEGGERMEKGDGKFTFEGTVGGKWLGMPGEVHLYRGTLHKAINLMHEVGHSVMSSLKSRFDDDDRAKLEKIFNKCRKLDVGWVSDYSKVDESEFWAECYVMYWTRPEMLRSRNGPMYKLCEKMAQGMDGSESVIDDHLRWVGKAVNEDEIVDPVDVGKWSEDEKDFPDEQVEKQHGPPPREGLKWKEETHRWIRPEQKPAEKQKGGISLNEAIAATAGAAQALDSLASYGIPYIVGGSVRDALLGRPIKDIDIEVHGIPLEELSEIVVQDMGGKEEQVGKQFGVFKVGDLDIALPRTETKTGVKHTDFDVVPDPELSLEQAARRRDFTVNALMYDYKTNNILDFFGGLDDIRTKTIRHVASDTFVEDPLRVYRAAQFAARFGFKIHPSTIELARTMDMSDIASERVYGEFEKLLMSDTPSMGLQALDEMNVLDRYFPEISVMKDTPQRNDFHAEGNVFEHTKLALDVAAELAGRFDDPKDKTILMLAVLCHDMGKKISTKIAADGSITQHGHEKAGIEPAKKFLESVMDEPYIIKNVLTLVETHLAPSMLYKAQPSDAAFRRLINKHGLHFLNLLASVSEADVRGRLHKNPDGTIVKPDAKEVEWFTSNIDRVASASGVKEGKIQPLISGDDLIGVGVEPGIGMGDILRDVQEQQEEGTLTTTEDAMAYVREKHNLQKQGPPGPAPRPGLQWRSTTHRWFRPEEIAFTEIPKNESYGGPDASLTRGLKGFSRKVSEELQTEGMSEILSASLNVDNVDAAASLAEELGFSTVTDRMVAKLRKDVYDLSQISLVSRGLPEEFWVYRGGNLYDKQVLPVSLKPNIAARKYFAGEGDRFKMHAFKVSRKDVLADVPAFGGRHWSEEDELLVNSSDLREHTKVRESTPEKTEEMHSANIPVLSYDKAMGLAKFSSMKEDNRDTHNQEQIERIMASDDEFVTVWHGTTSVGAKKILEEKKIGSYGGFGAGITLDPSRALKFAGGMQSDFKFEDRDRVVLQMSIPQSLFKYFTPEIGGLGSDELIFDPHMSSAMGQNEDGREYPEGAAGRVLPVDPNTVSIVLRDDDFMKNPFQKQTVWESKHDGGTIALIPPIHISEQLAIEGGQAPDKLHLTIVMTKFGKRSGVEWAETMRGLLSHGFELPEFQGKISGIERFEAVQEGHKDAIVATVTVQGLSKWRSKVVSLIEEKGYVVSNKHPFKPHITLAYVEPGEDIDLSQFEHLSIDSFSIEAWANEEHRTIWPKGDAEDFPDPWSVEVYDWIDNQLAKQGKSSEVLPFGAKTIGRGLELRLYGTLQEMVDDFLEGLTGTEPEQQVIDGVQELVDRWADVNIAPAEKAFEALFRSGFTAGFGGKIGSFDQAALDIIGGGKFRIGDRIVMFQGNAVDQFAEVIARAYTPDGVFDRGVMVEEMGKKVRAQRYPLERIARTETVNISMIGRLAQWAEDEDKYFWNYHWHSLPDSRRREMKRIRSQGDPYSFDEILFLWTHNKQRLPNGKWQMGIINCRCSISRSSKNEEFRTNRFAGKEGAFERTVDFPISIIA
jgi:tRNA nucleotidyltransferase (CCA-adding enzyme)